MGFTENGLIMGQKPSILTRYSECDSCRTLCNCQVGKRQEERGLVFSRKSINCPLKKWSGAWNRRSANALATLAYPSFKALFICLFFKSKRMTLSDIIIHLISSFYCFKECFKSLLCIFLLSCSDIQLILNDNFFLKIQ